MLKRIYILSLLVLFSSCEKILDLELNGQSQLAIDAWITDEPLPQQVRLTRTTPYFDSLEQRPVAGAQVFLTSDQGEQVQLIEAAAGTYSWFPRAAGEQLVEVGRTYTLTVRTDGVEYTATSATNAAPPIDSLVVRFEEEELGQPAGYYAEFYARDLAGQLDFYWIKAYKNGAFLSKPSEINISADGAFSPGGAIDGSNFISPIRTAINRVPDFVEDSPDNADVPPLELNDEVRVEIHGITSETYFFFLELRDQTLRDGGVGELFASPISNVYTNIISSDPDRPAIGFFGTAGVTSATAIAGQ